MKIHYFQRYHTKENVSTANTMLLLSRLYQYSPDRFFRFLKQLCYPDSADSFEPEIAFEIQEKNEDSIPDAIISQLQNRCGNKAVRLVPRRPAAASFKFLSE